MPDITSDIQLGVGIVEPSLPIVGDPSVNEELFCEKYLETFSIKLASEFVGVSPATGSRWLKENEKVRQYIGMRREQIASHLGVSQDWVIENWIEIANRGMGRVDGHEVDHGVALKATELLAKNLGMFEQTLNINHNIIPQMVIERYDDADYTEVDLIEGKASENGLIENDRSET